MLTGPIPAELGSIGPQLDHLNLRGNALTGPIPESFTQLVGLSYLSVAENLLSGQVSLAMAAFGEGITLCALAPGNPGLFMPDIQAYRDADVDGSGEICGLQLVSAEDIGENAVDAIEDLVPATLNGGQANSLTTKIENAIEKAASGQYNAAINQMTAFINQLNSMVANGTLTAEQAAPFIQQAEALIAIWTELL